MAGAAFERLEKTGCLSRAQRLGDLSVGFLAQHGYQIGCS